MDTELALKVWEMHPMLLSRALRLTGNYADAQDLAAETVTKAIASKHDGNPDLKPWLFAILRCRYLDMVRAPYVQRREDGDDFTDIADLPSDPDDELLKNVLRVSVELKPEDAEVLTLAALGNTCADIGKRLDISYAAAQARWFRAAKRLKSVMGFVQARRAAKESLYRGVSRHQNGWRARLRISKAQVVGRSGFKTEIEAAQAYNDLAIAYFGEDAVLNDISERLAA